MSQLWEYVDATGVTRRGYYVKAVEFTGSDICYHFKREDSGALDIVSGPRLKQMRRLGVTS